MASTGQMPDHTEGEHYRQELLIEHPNEYEGSDAVRGGYVYQSLST